MIMMTEIQVNGRTYRVEVDPQKNLLQVLRDDLELTGSKYGCGEGQCGACTVLVDDIPKRSCMISLESVSGKKITTIEGLEKNGTLHPLQKTFLDFGAMQCGYCTPGMIMSALGLLLKNPNPTEEDVLRHMQGNICRCGTYSRIVPAILKAARILKEEAKP